MKRIRNDYLWSTSIQIALFSSNRHIVVLYTSELPISSHSYEFLFSHCVKTGRQQIGHDPHKQRNSHGISIC